MTLVLILPTQFRDLLIKNVLRQPSRGEIKKNIFIFIFISTLCYALLFIL